MTGHELSTRSRIIDATLTLMVDRGLSGVTMTAVADSAGVARQTLYNHFADVEQIVAAAVESHQETEVEALRGVLATIDDPEARLVHLVRHAAATGVNHPPLPELYQTLSTVTRERVLDHEQALLRLVEDILRDGVGAGTFRADVDTVADGLLLRRMLTGVAELASRHPASAADVAATAARTLVAAVAA